MTDTPTPDDLTARLRDTGHVFARSPYHDLLDEAADRITELEAELAEAKHDAHGNWLRSEGHSGACRCDDCETWRQQG